MVKYNNKDAQELSSKLMVSEPERKITIYHALADYVTDVTENNIIHLDFVNSVAELSIIDRTTLRNIINNYKNYKYNNNIYDNILTSNDFLSLRGITKYISKADIEIIDKNYSLYINILLLTKKVYGKTQNELASTIKGD